MSVPDITVYVKYFFTFVLSAYYFWFLFILIVFHQFFTRSALGDVDLCLSVIFIPKTSDDEGGIAQAACLYHQCN
jgi:hypothetical protein